MPYKLIEKMTKKKVPHINAKIIKSLKKGTIIYPYTGCTYSCCKWDAYTLILGKIPFFDMPDKYIEVVK